MEIRPAGDDDLAGIARVRLAIDRDAHDDSGADPGYCRHLIADGHLLVGVDHGRVRGFAGAIDIGDARLLADLFIEPDSQGSGLGRSLLTAVMDGSTERFTFSSSDPRAMPIYARARMLPRWPLLYVDGPPARLVKPADLVAETIAQPVAVDFEQRMVGPQRSAQYRYWAGRAGSTTIGVRRNGELVGVGVVLVRRPMMRIEHVAVADPHDVGVFCALAHSGHGVERVVAYVPGPWALTSLLMDSGFRIADVDTYMSTSPSLVDERLMIVHPGLG